MFRIDLDDQEIKLQLDPSLPVVRVADQYIFEDGQQMLVELARHIQNRQREMEEAVEEARERGYQHGWEAAQDALLAKTVEHAEQRAEAVKSVEADLCQLVVEVVGRLIDGLDQQSRIDGLVRKGLAQLQKAHGQVYVRLHPTHLHYADALIASWNARAPMAQFRVVADEAQTPDSCRIENAGTAVDVNWKRMLQVIEQHFKDTLHVGAADVP